METSLIVTIIVALITAVIGPAVLEYVRSYIKRKESLKDPMYEEMESDILINEQLTYLLGEIDCDRIWIMQFHNGGHYYSSGVSIKKFSFFFEIVNIGISTIRDKFQNVPTSFFSRALKEIHDNEELCINDISDENQKSFGLRDTAESTGCQSLFIVSLKTPTGKLHGAMGVEFVKDIHEFTEDEKELIRDTANYVSGVLGLIHKFK
jgi:hypothetical protein